MNVTKDNFAEAAAQIEQLLPTAAFVAIDEEMTGISLPGRPEKMDDVPAKRYTKMREVASTYAIIQFGICLFHEREGGGGYVARAYNFYVFPESGPVNMEGTSVAFNRDHGMDWNKWIREGIPYVTRSAAEKLRASLLPAEASGPEKEAAPRNRITLTKKADVVQTDAAILKVKAWKADESRKEETECEVMTTNPFLRRYLYETFAADFPDLLLESRPVEGKRGQSTLVALRLDEAQRDERAGKKRAEKEAEFARKIGFLRVFKALAEAKKPVIGHNCMYDWLFALSHFEGKLPASYSEYKNLFHSLFPEMLDTKLLAMRAPFKYVPRAAEATGAPEHRFGSTALGEVYKVFVEEAAKAKEAGQTTVEVDFAPGFDRYTADSAAFHEAGYDAFITGYSFAHMAKEALSPERKASLCGITPMFRGVLDFNLLGEEELPQSFALHVRWSKGKDLHKLKTVLAAAGLLTSMEAVLEMRWIDDESAFALLPPGCREKTAEMLQGRADGENALADGLVLTAAAAWFAAETARAESASGGGGNSGGEPPAKRAKTEGPASAL